MPNATQSFADYLLNKAKTVADAQRKKADACLRDYLCVTRAGAAKNRAHWKPLFEKGLLGSGNALLIGYDVTADPKSAALVNGFNAHALELDDGQRFAMIHLGAPVISAVMAACAGRAVTQKDESTAIVMGYEAACRAAIAMQPSHKNRGYHAAGTCGTIGAAVGAAFVMGQDRDQLVLTLTAAAGSAAGMLEIQEQGSSLKPYNVGRAAMDGYTAACMGLTGFYPPDDMLGGERGFFATFSDEWSIDKLIAHSDGFEIERIYVKLYASCRHSHSAVEAAIRLSGRAKAEEISSVTVRTYRLGVKGHDHTDVQGAASAKLSTPYAVAAGLLYGRADLTVFEPLDERLVGFAKKVRVTEDPELSLLCPQKRVAVVTVRTVDGREFVCRVDHAKGEPENPASEEELRQKEKLLFEYAARLNGEGSAPDGL